MNECIYFSSFFLFLPYFKPYLAARFARVCTFSLIFPCSRISLLSPPPPARGLSVKYIPLNNIYTHSVDIISLQCTVKMLIFNLMKLLNFSTSFWFIAFVQVDPKSWWLWANVTKMVIYTILEPTYYCPYSYTQYCPISRKHQTLPTLVR